MPSEVDGSLPEQRIVEAAAVLPSFGGVTGWAALRWLGARWFEGLAPDRTTLPVGLVTSCADVRDQPGIRISAERLAPRDLMMHDSLRLTEPVRSVLFEMRYARGLRQAVMIADMAMYDDLVSLDELWAYALEHPGWTGIPQGREALALADENSWSPMETLRLRLPWELDAGLPRALCNRPVFDRAGRHIGTPDILDEEAGVAGEYEGELHLVGSRRGKDVRREDAFRSVGIETFTVTSADAADPENVVRRMLACRSRGRFEAASRRAWTPEPPSWWISTQTVAQRRSLSDVERDLVLRYRSG